MTYHFFDAGINNPEYALSLWTQLKKVAQTFSSCERKWCKLVLQVSEITTTVVKRFPDTRVGMHCQRTGV